MIYYYVFVVYLFIGFLFFLDLNEKIKTILGENLADHIALQMGMKPNISFKLMLIVCVLVFYPLILIVGTDKNKLDKFKEHLDEVQRKVKGFENGK